MGKSFSHRAIIPLFLGGLLFCAVFIFTGLSLGKLAQSVILLPLSSLTLFTLLTIAMVFISALKWKLVIGQGGAGLSTYSFFKHTLAGYSLNLMLPVFVSTLVVRSWALRSQSTATPLKNFATTVWDQGFDFLVAMCIAPFGILYLLGQIRADLAVLFSLALLAVCGLLFSFYAKTLFLFLGKLSGFLPFVGQKAKEIFTSTAHSKTVSSKQVALLVGLSGVRIVILLTRAAILAYALGFGGAWRAVVAAFTPVQAMGVLSLTPGNLGVAEWGLIGLLATAGVSGTLSATYAVLRRLLNFAVVSAILAIIQVLETLAPAKQKKEAGP